MANEHVALRFRASDEGIELLHGFFLSREIFAGSQENDDGSFTFFVEQSVWDNSQQAELDQLCASNNIENIRSEILEDHDWNAEWEATILPQWATSELLIAPSWRLDEAKALGPTHLITIDPKMSFGTGHHETTRLCLKAIELLDVKDKMVLDIGTGTGVLAIYALLRGAKFAVGIDTDTWSIANSIENRTLNNFTANELSIRTGILTEAVKAEEEFSVILANIHRNVLIEMAEQIRSHIAAGGMLILSGILIYDSKEVRERYVSVGFSFVRELQENEWACLIMTLPT